MKKNVTSMNMYENQTKKQSKTTHWNAHCFFHAMLGVVYTSRFVRVILAQGPC